MPQLANFAFHVVAEIFEAHGIYVLEKFSDGQVLWGDQPPADSYAGLFFMADYFLPDRYDVFTVKAIVNNLNKGGELAAIEKALYDRIHDQ
jgi:hypothetical protein